MNEVGDPAMTSAIGTSEDLALEPAAAPARPPDAGAEATRKALDRQQLEGRDAVQPAAPTAPSAAEPHKGTTVDQLV